MTVTAITKSHQLYIRELYILVLGFGLLIFGENFLSTLIDDRIFNGFQLLYFATIYYFMSYEWSAYDILTRRFPYTISRTFRSQACFLADLAALMLVTGLIFVAKDVGNLFHLLIVIGLFGLWHLTIMSWLLFAGTTYPISWRVWVPHLAMASLYGLFFLCLWLVNRTLPQTASSSLATIVSLLVLCGVIVSFSAWRKNRLIALDEQESEPAMSVGVFENVGIAVPNESEWPFGMRRNRSGPPRLGLLGYFLWTRVASSKGRSLKLWSTARAHIQRDLLKSG